ncbi:FitA-like ribbon-helix-helix domain-containing protein [Robbsia andropogonis]|uniref:FitA-like ribbon-helix-helix domain-containing protein n=1 Tax=Robbsia andropogonis TaxID=28092 RepID=UPI0004634A11
MKSLVVRNLYDALVEALRARAITNGRAEYREILSEVLGWAQRRSFAKVLASMPNVGRDADFSRNILPGDHEAARPWGHRRVPHPENEIDKLLAATAMLHGLTLVTRNVKHVQSTGVRILNPFSHRPVPPVLTHRSLVRRTG